MRNRAVTGGSMENEKASQETYIAEMKAMVDKAIMRMKNENPEFVVFTVSIWTDRDAAVSAINFDSLENSVLNIKETNEWNAKYSFEPITGNRSTDPADFKLRNFEEITHAAIPPKWYSSLIKIGKYAFFEMIKELNIDRQNFELGINSTKDWYAKTWNVDSLPKS